MYELWTRSCSPSNSHAKKEHGLDATQMLTERRAREHATELEFRRLAATDVSDGQVETTNYRNNILSQQHGYCQRAA